MKAMEAKERQDTCIELTAQESRGLCDVFPL